MKQKIAGILFLLAMPCSIFLYVNAEDWSGSEIIGLLAAVLFYVVVAIVLALVFNPRKISREAEDESHPER